MREEKKVILVTGANKGIGLEIVRQLARLNHEVILTARDPAKGKNAVAKLKDENLSVRFVPLDIDTVESIQAAAKQVAQTVGHLGVLINNAAILEKEDTSLLTNEWGVIHAALQTNSLAQLNVIRGFHTLFKKGTRLIITSSGGGSMSDPVGGWSPAYCISKSLVNAITRHLAYELSGQEISVNAFDPGWVKTDMGGKSAPRHVAQGADTAVWLATADTITTGKFFRDRKEIPW